MKKTIIAIFLIFAMNIISGTNACLAAELENAAAEQFEEHLYVQKTQTDVVSFLYSIYKGDIELVNQSLLKGADPNVQFAGVPVAFFALQANKPDVLDTLIKNGADIEAQYKGYSLLNYAILRKIPECVDVLIRNNADIKTETNGIVPLNFAIKKKNPDVVRLLIDAGVRPNLRALDAAQKSKDENIKNLVLNAAKSR